MLYVSTVLSLTVLLIVLLLQQNDCEAFVGKSRMVISVAQKARRPTLLLAASPSSSLLNIQQPFLLAEGLDPETLQALGEVTELNDALDSAVKAANPAVGLLTNVVASPYVILVPIGAGLLVAFLIGFFIFSYGQGKED